MFAGRTPERVPTRCKNTDCWTEVNCSWELIKVKSAVTAFDVAGFSVLGMLGE